MGVAGALVPSASGHCLLRLGILLSGQPHSNIVAILTANIQPLEHVKRCIVLVTTLLLLLLRHALQLLPLHRSLYLRLMICLNGFPINRSFIFYLNFPLTE